jgi:hypothetical protein
MGIINTRLLSHPVNWLVIGVLAVFWAMTFDIIARHYGNVSNPGRLAGQ